MYLEERWQPQYGSGPRGEFSEDCRTNDELHMAVAGKIPVMQYRYYM